MAEISKSQRVNLIVQDGLLAFISYKGADFLFTEGAARNDSVLLLLGFAGIFISGFAKFAAIANTFLLYYPPLKK